MVYIEISCVLLMFPDLGLVASNQRALSMFHVRQVFKHFLLSPLSCWKGKSSTQEDQSVF